MVSECCWRRPANAGKSVLGWAITIFVALQFVWAMPRSETRQLDYRSRNNDLFKKCSYCNAPKTKDLQSLAKVVYLMLV